MMNRKLLMVVSHLVEAHMFQDILADADIPMYISERNGPHIMDLYLGKQNEGVALYVDEIHYEAAKQLIEEAQIQD